MNIFSSNIIEEYLQEYDRTVPVTNKIYVYETQQANENIFVKYRIGEYSKYENRDKEMYIPITDLIDFTFLKLKKIEKSLGI
ncbi:hypothetical protein WAF17_16220 [Bernardetia sp. ABR2-2B]|uniref:hypothetical protein n=1 Tax=Bernardetia sp. ABR2-2B TaxID=3127472 RepID=UPI0030CCF1E3